MPAWEWPAERPADPGLGRVANVVEVEEQEGAALGRLEGLHGAPQPILPQSGEVDSLLVVDAHLAMRGDHAVIEVQRVDEGLRGVAARGHEEKLLTVVCGGVVRPGRAWLIRPPRLSWVRLRVC